MYGYVKATIFLVAVLWSLFTIQADLKQYKETQDKLEFVEFICKLLFIPCGIILFISCIF